MVRKSYNQKIDKFNKSWENPRPINIQNKQSPLRGLIKKKKTKLDWAVEDLSITGSNPHPTAWALQGRITWNKLQSYWNLILLTQQVKVILI